MAFWAPEVHLGAGQAVAVKPTIDIADTEVFERGEASVVSNK
jgi:hypothetical protein